MTDPRPAPSFDIREIPFSYHGSWFGISPVTAQGATKDDLHLVSHQTGMHAVLALRPLTAEGARADTRVEACASTLTWLHESGRVDLVYETPDTVRLRGDALGLRIDAVAADLTPFGGTYLYRDPTAGAYVFTSYETGRRYRVSAIRGALATSRGTQALGTAERSIEIAPEPGARSWEIAIEEYQAARPPYTAPATFEKTVESASAAFSAFRDAVAPWRSEHTSAADLAAYVLWSATVEPAGFLTRPAVLMSKHWMDKVWSWDHCFNALALAVGDPALAWDQFQLVFDHQDGSGVLPDSITHSEVLYNFVKPPVHGWALSALRGPRALGDLTGEHLAEAYRRLAHWTRYWLDFRRAPGSELPHYHHGNDSGWDNATVFDGARVVESADLAAFLILQMRELAALAPLVGRADEADGWNTRAHRMLTAMIDTLWADGRFATRAVGADVSRPGSSLLELMPIVLGDLLPSHIHAALADRISRHLTPYGLATELPTSPHYEADGYWRGPIWAPATVLIEDGLRRARHGQLADEISRRFRSLCETSGFAENFDALTGVGQRDRAYTWTASAYLILAAAAEDRRTGGSAR